MYKRYWMYCITYKYVIYYPPLAHSHVIVLSIVYAVCTCNAYTQNISKVPGIKAKVDKDDQNKQILWLHMWAEMGPWSDKERCWDMSRRHLVMALWMETELSVKCYAEKDWQRNSYRVLEYIHQKLWEIVSFHACHDASKKLQKFWNGKKYFVHSPKYSSSKIAFC